MRLSSDQIKSRKIDHGAIGLIVAAACCTPRIRLNGTGNSLFVSLDVSTDISCVDCFLNSRHFCTGAIKEDCWAIESDTVCKQSGAGNC
jgi:hypothetical protein